MEYPRTGGFSNASTSDESRSVGQNQSLGYGNTSNTIIPADSSCRDIQQVSWRQTSENLIQWSGHRHEQHCSEDYDISDAVLGYISQILMEEDIDERSCMLQDSLDLQMAEKSFYEVLGEKYPPSPENSQTFHISQKVKHPSENRRLPHRTGYASPRSDSSGRSSTNCSTICCGNTSSTTQLSHSSSTNSLLSTVDSMSDSQGCPQPTQLPCPNNLLRNEAGNASDFLYTYQQLHTQLSRGQYGETSVKFIEPGRQSSEENLRCSGAGRRKTRGREEGDIRGEGEERSSKQAAVYADYELRAEGFDTILLSSEGEGLAKFMSLRASLKDGVSKKLQRLEQPKGSPAPRNRRKKRKDKEELLDVRALLIQCAQAVASSDITSTNSLLKEIRRYASPFGDGTQRLAHCFADGLEARLAGTGSEICRGVAHKRRVASEMLKAYQLYLTACPFQRISNVVSNKTILELAANAKSIHVIDFGILYGFTWPTLIQHLSRLSNGPPKLRITGIELPQPGFRPAERVEETGRRLAKYAESFKVPFEYHAIAKKWESIEVEELKVDEEEVTIVNCMYRLKNLYDETVMENSSRDTVINLIRKLNPTLFILGVVNGTHNAPFFVTRFREALFHFSALFDMLDTIVPRVNQERMLIEKDLFGWDALNSVACEGWERVERPETYKQWQIRNLRAGFKQVPLDRKIARFVTDKVIPTYHKDFMMDEVNKWLLQGWKGRFLYGLSTWKPA